MRKTREEKAITLIALIITIVVLLILAVVAINAVTGDGIIQHATNAKTSYEQAQDEEQDVLSYYEQYLQTEGKAGTWKQEGDYIINNNGQKILIGTIVEYTPEEKTYISEGKNTGIEGGQLFVSSNNINKTTSETKTLKWIVLGEENGKVKLVASQPIAPVTKNEETNKYIQDSAYVLSKNSGYINGIAELNKICSIYGTGAYAESARSINENDIIKLCGITQEEIKNAGTTSGTLEYGSEYTFTYGDTDENGTSTVEFSKNGGAVVDTEIIDKYYMPDGTVIDKDNIGPKVIKSSYYIMDIENKTNSRLILKDITNNDSSLESYWLASNSIRTYENKAKEDHNIGFSNYGLKAVIHQNAADAPDIILAGLYDSMNRLDTVNRNFKVRPVVILKKDTVLTLENGVYELSDN